MDGSSTTALMLRTGKLLAVPRGLAELEIELGYTHLNSHDILDLVAIPSWQNNFTSSPIYYFFGAIVGWRQEWLGSYKLARFPVGATVGIKALLAPMVGIRAEYRPLRILNDPQNNFTEHRLIFGLSIFFRNKKE